MSDIKELKEQLFIKRKNGRLAVSDEVLQKADSYCEGYKAFLDAAKTEREAVYEAVKMAEKFQNVPLPKYAVINLNAPALPPEQLKPMKLARLSPLYCKDVYEKRINPYGQPYFWLSNKDADAVPLEKQDHEPGTDYAFLQEGHITCTFLGDFQDFNGDFAEKMQDL